MALLAVALLVSSIAVPVAAQTVDEDCANDLLNLVSPPRESLGISLATGSRFGTVLEWDDLDDSQTTCAVPLGVDTLDIDITDIRIGDVIKVGDLIYDNLEVLDPSRSMVYAIVSSRISKGMEMGEAEAEAAEAAEAEEGAEGTAAAAEGGEAPADADDAGSED